MAAILYVQQMAANSRGCGATLAGCVIWSIFSFESTRLAIKVPASNFSLGGVSGATIYVQDDLGSNPARVVIFGRTGMAKIVNQ